MIFHLSHLHGVSICQYKLFKMYWIVQYPYFLPLRYSAHLLYDTSSIMDPDNMRVYYYLSPIKLKQIPHTLVKF